MRPIEQKKSITLPKWAWITIGLLAIGGLLAIVTGATKCG